MGTVQDTDTYEYYDQSSSTMWGDALLRYDGTNFISYDAIGNPTGYYNSMSDIYTFSWQNGRQLASGTKGTTEFAYTYNADGLRTKKVVDGVTTEYYWAGSQLAMMIVNPDLSTKKVLKFYYDAEGRPMCLDFNGTVYYYITNLQGDVVALADQYGEVIRYEYDAWGKPISTYYVATPYHDAMYYNPLRYRGYIYDNETGFYYLQSRYYDPVVGRFINADSYASTGTGPLGYNMFAYCNNNPVIYKDSSGKGPLLAIFLIGCSIGVVIGFALTPVADVCSEFNDLDDASGQLYTSEKDPAKRNDNFEERVIWYDISTGATNDDLGYIEASTGIIKGEYSWKYFETEFGMGRVSGELSTDIFHGAGFSAMADFMHGSAYFIIPVFDLEIVVGVSGKIGSVGAQVKIGKETEIGLAVGIGGTFSVGFR